MPVEKITTPDDAPSPRRGRSARGSRAPTSSWSASWSCSGSWRIRWLAAHVIFLQFFTNVVLIAAFLGMSCGCLAARRREDWLARFPWLALGTCAAALGMLLAYHHWSGFAVDVGHQASPQEVFFGTEYRDPDVAQFVVPIELVAAVFFLLVALLFVGLGQVLGRAFDAYPDRILGYTLNIGGSLAGIAGFSALAFAQAPPVVWFLVGCAGVGYLLRQSGRLSRARAWALLALPALVATPVAGPKGRSRRAGRPTTRSFTTPRAATSASTPSATRRWSRSGRAAPPTR